MSITTRSTPPEPPPLLFGRRSSSTPPLSFPPEFPSNLPPPSSSDQAEEMPSDLPPPPLSSEAPRPGEEDIDMDASMTLPPSIQGQNHDRNDQQANNLEHPVTDANTQPSQTGDNGPAPLQPYASTPNLDNIPSAGIASAPPPRNENIVRISSNGSIVDSEGDVTPPIPGTVDANQAIGEPPADSVHGSPPPPPPPEDQEMSDGEDGHGNSQWRPLPEDTTSPNEAELKEIEDKVEHSAHDHEYWEGKTFFDLHDPEHTPKASGRIDWIIDNYNGTKEKPNQEAVMRSPIVNVGGYDWQIKFYPKGNDSEYLSIYIECVSLVRDTEGQSSTAEAAGLQVSGMETRSTQSTPDGARHHPAPLPALEDCFQENAVERPSVATQFSIALYNPNEPRVNHFHSYTHRFCPKSTDWGSTRFHGPFYRICYRDTYERQALLRNDTLAFTAYIRTVDDATGCLWEHSSDSNPWDSFTMTGLHSLSSPARCTDGNIAAAVSSWMLLRPFRQLLYNIQTPDPSKGARKPPMPIIEHLQFLLFQMRRPKPPHSGKVALEDLMDQFDFYGLTESVQKMDVVEIWEVLRAKMEDELRGTPWCNSLAQIFGPAKDHVRGTPTRRVKVKGFKSMTEAIKSAAQSSTQTSYAPPVLCLELDRQTFDPEVRRWKKLTDKISLDDRVTIYGESYILYGHVSHRGELQSGSYYSTLRPLGIGGKWYRYNNRSSECKVTCITQREAAQEQGSSSKSPRDSNKSVAYIAIYVSEQTFKMLELPEPEWEVPQWLWNFQPDNPSDDLDILDLQLNEFPEAIKCLEERQKTECPDTVDLQIIDSKAFETSKGPGILELFGNIHTDSMIVSLPMIQVGLPGSATLTDLQEHLKERLPEVHDRRQCALFIIDSRAGYLDWPQMTRWHDHAVFALNLGAISRLCPENRFWLYIIPLEIIEEQDRLAANASAVGTAIRSEGQAASEQPPVAVDGQNSSMPPNQDSRNDRADGEDSPMSDADDPEPTVVVPSDQPVLGEPVILEATMAGLMDGAAGRPSESVTPLFGIADPPNESATNANAAPEAIMEDPPVSIPPPPPPPAELEETIQNNKDTSRSETVAKIALKLDFSMLLRLYETLRPQTSNKTEIYFFLKMFDVSTQTLKHVSSHMVSSEDSLEVISKLLKSDDKQIDLFEETNSGSHKLRANRTFAQEHIHDGAVIIARGQVTDSARHLAEGRFVEPEDYIRAQAAVRNFPHLSSCHLTRSYFSSSYFKGSIFQGLPHGLGEHISLGNNEAYRGELALGQRHGHGRLVYANGDVFDGTFESGLPNGRGTLLEHATGNEYSGGWKNGKRHGQGVTMWKQAEDESGKRCKICWEGDADTAFLHCGHVAACMDCAQNLDDCPVCRGRVAGVVKLWFVS